MAVELNILTFALLDKKDRNAKGDLRMINFAKSSLYHWRKSDKYDIANEHRGQWLLSYVYSKLNKSNEALHHAKRTLKITEENTTQLKDYDLAYAYESMARAYSVSGNKDKAEQWHNKAKEAGDLIESECDKEYFIFDLDSK